MILALSFLILLNDSAYAIDTNQDHTDIPYPEGELSVVDCRSPTEEDIRREERARQFVGLEDKLLPVHFDFNKTVLHAEQKTILDSNIVLLKEFPNEQIYLEGHTDQQGSKEYNFTLGTARAESVKAYLVSHGIAEDKIYIVSFGEGKPFPDDIKNATQSQLRRVEFGI